MLSIIIFAVVYCITAFEIEYDSSQRELLFINRGSISKIDGHAQLQYKINVTAFEYQSGLLDHEIDQVNDICANIKSYMNCELLEALLKKKNSFKHRSIRDLKSSISDSISVAVAPIMIMYLFGTESASIDQNIIDRMQQDISYNRELINNQSIILSRVVDAQNLTINSISDEIKYLKSDIAEVGNNMINNKLENRFTNLIQSIFLKIFNKREISNALSDLIFDPKPSDILKILDKNIILNDLHDLDENFHPLNKSIKNLPDILEILAISEISIAKYKNEITIFIDIPFYRKNWTLFEIIPLVFKGKGNHIEITGIERFMVRSDDHYSLISKSDLSKCKLHALLYLCSFIPLKPTKPTCENNVFMYNKTDLCNTVNVTTVSKIIQTDKETFFINTHEKINMNWNCPNLGNDNWHPIDGNAWMKLNPGCTFTALNKTYFVSYNKSIVEPTFPTNGLDIANENWNQTYVTLHPNEMNSTNVIHENLYNISIMTNDTYAKSNVKVEKIRLPIKFISFSIISTIIILGILACCLIYICKKL